MTHHYDRLIHGMAVFAGLVIAAACLLIAYDVIARNLGMQPPASTVALTEYALLYFTMAAAPYLVRSKGHIVVEVVYQRLPDRRNAESTPPFSCCAPLCRSSSPGWPVCYWSKPSSTRRLKFGHSMRRGGSCSYRWSSDSY